WRKFWFVLTPGALKFYRDTPSEERDHAEGVVELSPHCAIADFQVQRNFGFQIKTKYAVHTLAAVTPGIRKSWMEAIGQTLPPVRMDQSGRSEDGGGAGSVPGNGTYKTYFQTSHAAAQAGPCTGQEAPRNAAAAAASDRFQPRAVASRPAEPEARPAVATPQGQKPPHVRSTPTREAGGVANPGFARGALNPSDGKARAVLATSVSQTRLLPDKQGPDPSWAPSDRGRAAGDEADGPGAGGGRRRPGGREGEAAGAAVPRAPLSRDEIEQRWRQVEKTPVREEKQIPIATIKPTASSMSPESMVELLQKELEHVQQDLRSSRGENSALLARLRALEQSEYSPAGFVSQATCERGLAAMEESHQRSMEDLQRKHQHDMQLLRQQSEQLLAEETAATIAALEAMKSAHRDEFERELEKALKSRHGTGSQDAELIRKQHEEELASIQRELGVLSEQYSQKCLENSHLSQALDAERQALQQCQRENEELNTRCQELNKRLATELMRIRSIVTGDSNGAVPSLAPGKDTYELEVMLRVKDSEIQYFKQEINALKEELQSALRDKKYATDKYKDIYTELSISRAKADLDVTRLREQLQTISQGEERAGYDILKSKSIPDFFKTQTTSSCKRTVRNLRSK
ncbi:unnamed protein product, partial [Lampetra fluviatilis]